MIAKRKETIGLLWLIFLALFLMPPPASAQDELPAPGKPLTLDQAVGMALKFHPTLQSGQASVVASRARVEQALSAYYPQLALNTSYNSATANFVVISGATFRQPAYNWTFFDVFAVGPSLTMNIYDFGRTSNAVQVNRENVKASEQDLATTRQNVVLNVKQAYYGVLQTLRLIQVAEDTVKQMQDHLAQTQGFYQAGTRPKIDVTKAEVDLANAQLALIQSKNNYEVAQVTLNNALGLRRDLTFPLEDILGIRQMGITLEQILQSAYEQRPEILKIKAQERAQQAAVNLAKAGYYPTLSGSASYLFRAGNPDWDLKPLYWDMTAGVTLSIPLFSGFLTPNQVAEARANLRNLQAQEETARQNIRLESDQAFLGLKLANEQIGVTEKNQVQAQENFELATGRYQVGVGSPLEVTDAEVLLANARANYITALYNYKIAEARIEKAMGLVK
jgi:outer membrane protein